MLWFGLDFPDPKSPRKFLPWLRWPLTIPLLLMGLVRAVAGAGEAVNLAAFAPVIELSSQLAPAWFWLTALPIGVFFANLGYKTSLEQAPDSKRRLRLLLWGAAIGLTPMFLLLVGAFTLTRGDFTQFPTWIWVPPLVLMMVFPATLAYVIVVWRAMDVGVVLRQGLQYALATRGLAVLRVALIAFAVFLAIDLGKMTGMNALPRWLTVLSLIAIVVMTRFGVGRLRGWLDRRFFREQVQAEHLLADLGDEIRSVVEVQPLLSTVARRISESLHVSKVAVLLRNNGYYQIEHTEGYDAPPLVRLPANGDAIARISSSREPLRVYWEDPESWVNRDLRLSPDYDPMRTLGCQLLLAVRVRSELLGVMSLGPKRSEEAYSHSDIRLLQSVATQTAFALENSQLTATVAHEAAQRERFARELEIAKEVQEQLLTEEAGTGSGAGLHGPLRSGAERRRRLLRLLFG